MNLCPWPGIRNITLTQHWDRFCPETLTLTGERSLPWLSRDTSAEITPSVNHVGLLNNNKMWCRRATKRSQRNGDQVQTKYQWVLDVHSHSPPCQPLLSFQPPEGRTLPEAREERPGGVTDGDTLVNVTESTEEELRASTLCHTSHQEQHEATAVGLLMERSLQSPAPLLKKCNNLLLNDSLTGKGLSC